jgi:hypothetical protein
VVEALGWSYFGLARKRHQGNLRPEPCLTVELRSARDEVLDRVFEDGSIGRRLSTIAKSAVV